MKKVILLMVIGIMLSISLLVGVSYALWSNTHVQETENIVETGCFSTDFSEVNSISLSNSYPISDERGMSSIPYQFTITNTCTVDAKYEVNFEVLADSTLSSNYVKLAIDNKKDVLSNYESKTPTIEGALSSSNIASGWLKAEESITYDLRLWIDEETTLEQGEGKSLNGKVVVVSVGDELNDSLISLLLEQYKEGNEVGLVKDANNPNLYYYTGTNEEVANNFLWYGGHQWRVLDFDTDAETLTLITQQPLTAISVSNTSWTTELEYDSSYINQWLNDYFWNSLDNSIQNNILESKYSIGNDSTNKELTVLKKVGLLSESQYLRSGGSNSFLNINDYWWIFNSQNQNNVKYVLCNDGKISVGDPSFALGVRAVLKVFDINVLKGNGTLYNSYRGVNNVTNVNDIQIGEYVNIPYAGSDKACGIDNQCTMRVVSKNESGIKVVLNGLLPTLSSWANDASDNITTKDIIYANVLNPFLDNIDSQYTTIGTYGVGVYSIGSSFTVPVSTTIEASIGLPTVGEMFSGNDLDLSMINEKSFVDVKTIENSTVSNYYWTGNLLDSSNVRLITVDGDLHLNLPSNNYGVRPVLYLKNNLNITGGSGTAQDPYTLLSN